MGARSRPAARNALARTHAPDMLGQGLDASPPPVTTKQLQSRVCFLVGCSLIPAARSAAGPLSLVSDSEKLTAVSSSSHNGYARTRLADGSFRPETYAFGEGGILGAFLIQDPTFDGVGFTEIARMLAEPLASQSYVPAHDPYATNLLIMVFWGETTGGVNTQDGGLRDELNFANARLLGFDSEGSIQSMSDASTPFFGRSFRSAMLNEVHSDVLSAIEVNRYYVILRAFDFQAAWKQRRMRMLWETRFSLSERMHDFERDLPAMAQNAALYFGRDSYGLVLKPIPEGRVEVGEARAVEDRPDSDGGGPIDDPAGMAGDWRGATSAFPPLMLHVDPAGNSTFVSPRQHADAPALVSEVAGAVVVKVPGWGLIVRGTLKGDRITGTISQYGTSASVTLTRVSGPAGVEKPRADLPGK
jgi:hypothetical protein